MHYSTILSVLACTSSLVAAAPQDSRAAKIAKGLRLIKTSETDPGRWVTDEQKITEYVSKDIGFIDITDITDNLVLTRMSTKPSELRQIAAVTYPAAVSRQSVANPLIAQVSNTQPQAWLKTMTDFYNRYYRSTYGTQAATWMFNTVKAVAAPNTRIVVSQFTHSSYNQPSVIARIPGTSTNVVVVSAHYDSTGGSSTARGPGADDNGSGVVVILEALRVLANAKYAPKNTLEFHFYSGEEGGLLGSGAIFSNYRTTGKTVLAVMNQDMAGYSPSGKISVYNDYSDAGLNAYTKKVVVAYGGGQPTTDTCGYGCSDHASAYNNGFPAVYVCDEPIRTSSPYIHSPNDAYNTIQWPAILRHSKFTVGFLVEASFI